MPTSKEVFASLTGPGGGFEVVEEEVLGNIVKVFKTRMKSLREIAELAKMRGDDNEFIVYDDQRIGFESFVNQSNAVGAALCKEYGVTKGDRIAVLSANNPQWCQSFWGAVNMGSILVGLNGWWNTDEILYGLSDSGAKVLVVDSPRFARVADQLDSIDDLEAVFVTDVDDTSSFNNARVHPFGELLDCGSNLDPIINSIEEDDPAVIFYTSGTTGKPKGAISTHRSMIANLQDSLYIVVASAMINPERSLMPSDGKPVGLLTSPLFHVSGCHSGLVIGMAGGLKLVLISGRFEPQKAMELIEREKVSVWTAVPTMVWRVLEDPKRFDYDLSSVRSISYGGSPSGSELQRRIHETFPNVRSVGNAYGLTESSSAVTINTGDDIELHPESVGRALPVVEIKIVGENGDSLPPSRVGEIYIRGPIIMPGYWNKPDETAEILSPDGWLRTGDLGYLDRDGFLYITDRIKDMIIRGGENIYCVEIENRLEQHPAVIEAAVIGVPHPTLGEQVKAIVRVEQDTTVNEQDIINWVAAGLAGFKVPTFVELTYTNLPRNPSGKILKNVLRGTGEVSFTELM